MELKSEIKILEGCGNYKISKSGKVGLRITVPKELKDKGFDVGATVTVYFGEMGKDKAMVVVLKEK